MSGTLRGRLTRMIGKSLPLIFPRHLRGWADGMACEIAVIECERRALAFALGGLRVAALQALLHFIAPPAGASGAREGTPSMSSAPRALQNPRQVGLVCAIGAGGLGLAYLQAAGAPARYITMNAAALVIGLAAFAALGRLPRQAAGLAGPVALACGLALVATAFFGNDVEGAARWVRLGALNVQTSLLLLVPLLLAFANRRDAITASGVILAAIAMALQPDRAMAGVILAATGVLAAAHFTRVVAAAFLAALVAFAVTVVRPDALPAVRYVDGIFYSAFDLNLAAGLAVTGGALLLLVPAVVGTVWGGSLRHLYLTFGAAWLVVLIAAALGNYPTPMVGYGGSAIVGYLISLAFLPRVSRTSGAPSSSGRSGSATADEGSGRARAALA